MTNKLIVFSAPSGAGKTTLVKYIIETFSDIEFSISATSRIARGDEKDGVDYYFLSNKEFKARIENEEFIEYEEVYGGKFYGTLKSEVDRIWKANKIAIFDIDVVGGANIKNMFPGNLFAFDICIAKLFTMKNRLRIVPSLQNI